MLAFEAGWGDARTSLHIDLDFEGVKQTSAMEALRAHAEAFAPLVDDRENQTIVSLIDQALDDGWTPAKLASGISASFAEGYHIYDDSGALVRTVPTDSWSEMVARTELSRAQTAGALALYRDAAIEKVMYVTTQGPSVCDECAPLDGQVFAIDDLGDNTPPIHPRCCCALVAADDDVSAT